MTKQDILSQSVYLWQDIGDKKKTETALFLKSMTCWSLYWEGIPKKTSKTPLIALQDEYNRPVVALYAMPDSPFTLTYLTTLSDITEPTNEMLRFCASWLRFEPGKRHDMLLLCEENRIRLIFDGKFADESPHAGMPASDLFSVAILPESGTETVGLWDYAFLEDEYSILCSMKKHSVV